MQLKRMEQSGVLDNIRKKHYPSTVKDCKESKVSLGYNQVWFPIIILFLGISFSIFLGYLESAYHKHGTPNHTKYLFPNFNKH